MTVSVFPVKLKDKDSREEPMSSQIAPPNTEAAILARIIQSEDKELTSAVARYLLSMRLPLTDEARVNELSAKARSGLLSDNEKQELESYLHIGVLLGVMQSKARQCLSDPADFARK